MPTFHVLPGRYSRRAILLGGLAGLLAGCQGGGDFTLFGYTTKPPFDPNIRSVYIPIFKVTAFHASPYRGIEVDLTEAIVQEINSRRTPMRVVSDPSRADTELVGTITNITKLLHNRTRENFNREFDVLLTVEVVWRDLRSGKVLSGVRQANPSETNPIPFDPNLPPASPPPVEPVARPTVLNSTGRVLIEVGETDATGIQAAVKQMARQIVNMMETPWDAPPPRR